MAIELECRVASECFSVGFAGQRIDDDGGDAPVGQLECGFAGGNRKVDSGEELR